MMPKNKGVYLHEDTKKILNKQKNVNGYINDSIRFYEKLKNEIDPFILEIFLNYPERFDFTLDFKNTYNKEVFLNSNSNTDNNYYEDLNTEAIDKEEKEDDINSDSYDDSINNDFNTVDENLNSLVLE